LAVFFAALLFYLFYGEKLAGGDWIGACLIVAGTSMIGLFAKQQEETQTSETSVVMLTWLAILMTIVMACSIGTLTFTLRFFMDKVPFTPMQFNLDGYAVSTAYMVILVSHLTIKNGEFPYDQIDISIGILISVLQIFGSVSTTLALKEGKGGSV
jgi:drug/metabolite transporter (DMT)-like permease